MSIYLRPDFFLSEAHKRKYFWPEWLFYHSQRYMLTIYPFYISDIQTVQYK